MRQSPDPGEPGRGGLAVGPLWLVAARILGVLATAIAITLAIRIGLGLTA